MVQNLNNNLITAPELTELRKRLRNLETRVRLSDEITHRLSELTMKGWPNVLRRSVSIMVL